MTSKPAPTAGGTGLSSFRTRYAGWRNQRRIARLARQVARHSTPDPSQSPVVVFNATTRLTGLSLNAAFSLLASWGLRLAGVPVIHFVCRSGMSHCVLGTSRRDYTTPPPCDGCVAQSDRLYRGASVQGFTYSQDAALASSLAGLSVTALSDFEFTFDLPGASGDGAIPPTRPTFPIPLGRLVLPSIRWALRVHNLPNDEPTRYLLRQYILSAYHVASQFTVLLEAVQPQAAVIFNGMMYPEAAARWVARQMGVRSVAHEVGFQRFSTFFTQGEPTAYPIHIPADFALDAGQNARLDAYLEQRFRGKFTMAGIQFWPEMRGLDPEFLEKAAAFRQIVPIFTNVVYDTSQVHANVVFPHMFAWLDLLLEVIRAHPETLFVIRAHPDEMRPGTAKQSRESVRAWVAENGLDVMPNVFFIDSGEYVSSYELIQRAKFVIVYNSSIGMEAALMGAAVLCGGKARYTQYPIVFFPPDQAEYRLQLERFLEAESIQVPPEFRRNARRFLYYQLYRASLPLDNYLESSPRMGFVQLRPISWQQLLAGNSPTMQVLLDGILGRTADSEAGPFLIPDLP